ncbi:hypothetical protein ACHAWF_016778 [Thalassiosira exigua]
MKMPADSAAAAATGRDSFTHIEETFLFESPSDHFVYHKHTHECKPAVSPLSIRQALASDRPSNDDELHLLVEDEPVNAEVVRSVAMLCGSNVVSLRFDATADLTDEIVEGVLPHLSNVRHLQFDRVDVTSASARSVARFCHRTLRSLRLSGCPRVTSESLGWLAGGVGHDSPKLRRLRALDISGATRADDRGLAFLTRGLGKLERLDLSGCPLITFAARNVREDLGRGSFRSMTALNLRGCRGVDDVGVAVVASAMPKLRHLDLGLCGRLTDASAKAIGEGCPNLRVLGLEGARGVTDGGLGTIANRTKLDAIDVTGCDVSRKSLMFLVRTLGYVEEATTFFGFVAREGGAREAARDEEAEADARVRRNEAVHAIQGGWKVKRHTIHQIRSACEVRERDAAKRIQSFLLNCMSRRRFRHLAYLRTAALASVRIQKWIRGWLDRRRTERLASRRLVSIRHATTIQTRYRGKFVRSNDKLVMPAILAVRAARLARKRRDAGTTIQCFWRNVLALKRLKFLREDLLLRTRSSALLQRTLRGASGRRRARRFRMFAELDRSHRRKMAIRMQCSMRQYLARRRLDYCLDLASRRHLARHEGARKIQSRCRGARARRAVERKRLAWNAAAVEVQRMFRGCVVPSWQEMKREAVTAYIRSQAELEHAKSLETRATYAQSSEATETDEAPLPGTPGDKDLLKYVFGRAFVELRCLVYWPDLGLYKLGSISDYDDRMWLWKIDYDRDDGEWLDLVRHRDRILVSDEGGGADWIPYEYCRPLALTRYLERRKAIEPSNSTWAPPRAGPDKVSSEMWYCAYLTRGLLDECYRAQSHEALHNLRSAHLVKTMTVTLALVNYLNCVSDKEVEGFRLLLNELNEFLSWHNNKHQVV